MLRVCIVSCFLSLCFQAQNRFTSPFKEMYDQSARFMHSGENKKALSLLEKSNPKNASDSGVYFTLKGNIMSGLGQPDSAEAAFKKSLAVFRKLKPDQYLAAALNDYGSWQMTHNQHVSALEKFQESVKIYESIKDTLASSGSLHNIGYIYMSQGDFERAKAYTRRAVPLNMITKNYRWLGRNYSQLCELFISVKQKDSALHYGFMAYDICKRYCEPKLQAYSMQEIGIVYGEFGDFAKAEKYFDSALVMRLKVKDEVEILSSYGALGEMMFIQKKYKKAKEYVLKALKIATDKKLLRYMNTCYRTLCDISEAENDYKGAYTYYKAFRETSDSLHNEKITRSLLDKEYKFNFEHKEALLKAENEKKMIRAEEEKKQQKIILYSVSVALILFVALGALMFRTARLRKKANRELSEKNALIENQKAMAERQTKAVEEKQKEILDSIRYAQKIQRALITNETYIERKLKELNPPGKVS